MTRFVFFFAAVFSLYCSASSAQNVAGAMTKATTFTAGYCGIITACGTLSFYTEDMYEALEVEEDGDPMIINRSARTEIHIDNASCGGDSTVLVFDITPKKRARPKYQAYPFAGGAALAMRGSTKDVPTQTLHTVNNLVVTWDGGYPPQVMHASFLNGDGSVDACQSFTAFPDAVLDVLRINKNELFLEDISCNIAWRFDATCATLVPE